MYWKDKIAKNPNLFDKKSDSKTTVNSMFFMLNSSCLLVLKPNKNTNSGSQKTVGFNVKINTESNQITLKFSA